MTAEATTRGESLDPAILAAIELAYDPVLPASLTGAPFPMLRPLGASRVVTEEGSAQVKVLLEDVVFRGGPVLAIVDLDGDGDWRLRSLRGQCASCFGVGVAPDDAGICDTCGGEGWGVADSTPLDLSSTRGPRD